jgi:hypothetical protein
MSQKFEMIKINQTTIIEKDGMELEAYIAGVNSGAYGLPFVIVVRTWARKWFWKKFFYREMKLSLRQVMMLRDECQKVIDWNNEKNNN